MAEFKGTNKDFDRERLGNAQRQKQQFEFEEMKKKLKEKTNIGLVSLGDQFSKADLTSLDSFKSDTIGLVTADEFRKKRKLILEKKKFGEDEPINSENAKKIVKEKEHQKTKIKTALSFDPFEADNNDEDKMLENIGDSEKSTDVIKVHKKGLKNPFVDTSFLPNKERQDKEKKLIKALKKKWLEKQEEIKKEKIEITYIYWDGSGHRRKIILDKGKTVFDFLEMVKESLSNHFIEFRSVSVENIMYVKGDCIIPLVF